MTLAVEEEQRRSFPHCPSFQLAARRTSLDHFDYKKTLVLGVVLNHTHPGKTCYSPGKQGVVWAVYHICQETSDAPMVVLATKDWSQD